jgi:hypothetical protein
MDKDDFKKKLGEFFTEKNVKSVRQLEPGMIIVCTRGSDFDPATNALWDRWGNKSAVRDDVRCCGCCEALAVSNWVYGKYIGMDDKPRPYCMHCAGDAIKAEEEKEAKEKEEKERLEREDQQPDRHGP